MDKPDGSLGEKTRRDKNMHQLEEFERCMPTCLFPTPFTDEVLENVGGHKFYSFTNGFSGYHQIKIAHEDRYKTMFAT
jgi:hypothetical protein